MTSAQKAKAEELARRFGCWPNDIVIKDEHALVVDVVIGQHKGRPKTWKIKPNGRIHGTTRA